MRHDQYVQLPSLSILHLQLPLTLLCLRLQHLIPFMDWICDPSDSMPCQLHRLCSQGYDVWRDPRVEYATLATNALRSHKCPVPAPGVVGTERFSKSLRCGMILCGACSCAIANMLIPCACPNDLCCECPVIPSEHVLVVPPNDSSQCVLPSRCLRSSLVIETGVFRFSVTRLHHAPCQHCVVQRDRRRYCTVVFAPRCQCCCTWRFFSHMLAGHIRPLVRFLHSSQVLGVSDARLSISTTN